MKHDKELKKMRLITKYEMSSLLGQAVATFCFQWTFILFILVNIVANIDDLVDND